MKRSKMPKTAFAIPSKKKYPINTPGRRKNAIARVEQHGSAAEKRAVYSAIRRRDPGLAKRSGVIPTKGGKGRHYGEPKGKRH